MEFIEGKLNYADGTYNLEHKYYDNYYTSIGERYSRLTTVMGGNYGIGDSYLVIDKGLYFILTYNGDQSCNIKYIGKLEDKAMIKVDEFINNQEKQYLNSSKGHFIRYI